jgi:hypothetical protein
MDKDPEDGGDSFVGGSLLRQPEIFAKQLHTRVAPHKCGLWTVQRKADPHRSNAYHALQLLDGPISVFKPAYASANSNGPLLLGYRIGASTMSVSASVRRPDFA